MPKLGMVMGMWSFWEVPSLRSDMMWNMRKGLMNVWMETVIRRAKKVYIRIVIQTGNHPTRWTVKGWTLPAMSAAQTSVI